MEGKRKGKGGASEMCSEVDRSRGTYINTEQV